MRADLSYVDAVVINKIQYNFKASLNLEYFWLRFCVLIQLKTSSTTASSMWGSRNFLNIRKGFS